MPRSTSHLIFCLLAVLCAPFGCTTYSPKPHNAAAWALLSPEVHGTLAPLESSPKAHTKPAKHKPPGPSVSPRATSKPLAITPAARRPAPVLTDIVEPAPKKVQAPQAAAYKTPQQAYQACKKKGKISFARRAPKGALVFFHNTRDLNGDGRNNDWYTTTAQVLSPADSKGTLSLQVQDAKGADARVNLNLDYPDIHTQSGTTYNTALRPKLPKDPPFTQYLAGELFAGFCTL